MKGIAVTSADRSGRLTVADFGIAAAQVASVCGEIDVNVATHAAAMAAASRHGVSMLVFPELSLTGYEPALAAGLAIDASDRRLDSLRELSRRHRISAIVGAPLKTGAARPALGAILFAADGTIKSYHKMHLGSREPAFFESGDQPLDCTIQGLRIGFAICGDASQASHPEHYAASGASIYAVGAFLNAKWYASDVPRLAGYAARLALLTVMANHGASVGSDTSVGKSTIWDPNGALLVQAIGTESALIIARHHDDGWQGEIVGLPD